MNGVSTKVAASTAGAAVTTLVFWLLGFLGVTADEGVQGAFTVLVVLAAGYLIPERATKGDHEA